MLKEFREKVNLGIGRRNSLKVGEALYQTEMNKPNILG